MIAPKEPSLPEERDPRHAELTPEKRAALRGQPKRPVRPLTKIPVRVMASMRRYLAALEGCGDHEHACRMAKVGETTARVWWPKRYPAFVGMRDAALRQAASALFVSARDWALNGYVQVEDTVTTTKKNGDVVTKSHILRHRSERLMDRFLAVYFSEFRETALPGGGVTVNVNTPEERREVLVVVSDPEARAAIRRARDRALLPAGGAGESGEGGDGGPAA